MSTYANEMAAIKSQLMPVGTIIEWCPVDGGPDLSTPDKVAAYYGFGEWEAYGAGRMTLGQSASHVVGSTGGEETHKLTAAQWTYIDTATNSVTLYADIKPSAYFGLVLAALA